jgi:hypothetical protein
MTEHHRFMTYTQMEKTYRRILARRMPGHQKRQKAQMGLGKRQSDNPTLLRPMTVEGRAKARPLSHHSLTLERITA